MAARVSDIRPVAKLFVGRIPWFLGNEEVKGYFAQFGRIRRCWMPFNKETGFHKGFSLIGFSSKEGLDNALQKSSHIIEGVQIHVSLQQPRFSRKDTRQDEK
ncbi:SRA stem-loop-interacting RNA-binding protein, mitochondrial [Emydura macquarii macquarii]|uniref:SRA stem-loop-interacting RNA-binding protein, mitochondrial n=1 Tax=Emydura macquarii macquarii TaxID=1129001 RepID=UPI00352AF421